MNDEAKIATVDVGIVVIGRNEGGRLINCLESVKDSSCYVIYVDSGSIDNSVEVACNLADKVIELDPARPFSAARARNEGFEELLQLFPQIQFVQFLDGDCILAKGWLEAAKTALIEDQKRAVVIGHLQEAYADASPYNRLCALEWKSIPGDLDDFGGLGGISMIRADIFRQLDGFNADVIAGEDSEFGVRLSLAGYLVTKIDYPMATHDANMTRFIQWWKRAVRAGHAIGQRSYLNGQSDIKDCVRERKSTWFWGIGLPLLILVFLVPSHGLSLILLGGYVFLGTRIFRFRRGRGDTISDAFLYTRFLLLAKLANGMGLIKFQLNKLVQRYTIIEYK